MSILIRPHRHRSAFFAVPLCALLVASGSVAQEHTAQGHGVQSARPEDVASIDAIIAAVYDVISGPAGEARDWARFRSLFVPSARLIPTRVGDDGTVNAAVLTPDEFIESSSAFFEQNGFFESEIGRVTEEYGHIAHAFSSYESKRTPEDAEPFQRGINSMQLLNDGERWWFVTIYWDAERPDSPIPERYLRVGAPD